MLDSVTVWLGDNLWVLLAVFLPFPFLFSLVKAKFPVVVAVAVRVLSFFKGAPKSTSDADEEAWILDILKGLSAKEGAPIPATPVDTNSDVVTKLFNRVKLLAQEKEQQLKDKLAALTAPAVPSVPK